MKNIFKALKVGIIIILTCFMLTACSQVNQDNFNKIKSGMTMDQVVAILGKPDKTQSIAIPGLSGTSATWQGHDSEITIQFANDKVAMKNFNKK